MESSINYEALASDYARYRSLHPGVLRQLIEHAGIESPMRVVEVGSGTGNYLIAIHEATGCHAAGVEPSPAMIEKARARSSAIAWLPGSAEELPLKDEAADFIFSVDVIHHVSDRDAYFRESRRALTAGGLICTATDSPSDLLRRRPLSNYFPETVAEELKRYPAIDTLRSEMEAAGFTDLTETHVELEYPLTDIAAYRNRAYSSLQLIPEDALNRGIAKLESDLGRGPISALSLYTLLWGTA